MPSFMPVIMGLGGTFCRAVQFGIQAFFGVLCLGELVSLGVCKAGGLMDEDVDLYQDRVQFRVWRCKTD